MLIDIATSNPPFEVLQLEAAEKLKSRMGGRPVINKLIEAAYQHSGIDKRYIVIPDADENAAEKVFTREGKHFVPDTKVRMNEYEKWSKILAAKAVKNLLTATNTSPDEINKIVTISCTGFYAPGLDSFLINKFNFPLLAKRINIGFMGCAASIIGFNSVLESLKHNNENDKKTLLVSLEICSLHLQIEATRDNILANMIFADGCAATLFSQNFDPAVKLNLISTHSVMFKNSEEYMGWKIGSTGFEMILSSKLPQIILDEAVPSLIKILEEENLTIDMIKYWALHPGGRAILDSLQKGLCLNDEKTKSSRRVLKNFGNMSSASILFVIKDLLDSQQIKKDEICCAVAFGPGLTMEVALFRGV